MDGDGSKYLNINKHDKCYFKAAGWTKLLHCYKLLLPSVD